MFVHYVCVYIFCPKTEFDYMLCLLLLLKRYPVPSGLDAMQCVSSIHNRL